MMDPGNRSKGESIRFGLIVIGDELLIGQRQDGHFDHFRNRLRQRGHELNWHWILPDEMGALIAHLRFSMSRSDPVFACGGIGATPDDLTRASAAVAAERPLTRHPEAAALIEQRFGDAAYPDRIAMADLPEGCDLIPNPYNQIPGFSIHGHHFLPGFPEMAWPMAEWVLDHHYANALEPLDELAVRITGIPESRLVPVMQRLSAAIPEHKLFSLPHLGEPPYILLGLRGRTALGPAFSRLCSELELEGLHYEPIVTKA